MKLAEFQALWEQKYAPLLTPELRSTLLKKSRTLKGTKVSTIQDFVRAISLLNEYLKVCSADDLATITDPDNLWKPLHQAVKFRLAYVTPMLAMRYDSISLDLQEEMFTSDKFLFTEKLNGVRAWLCLSPDYKCHLFARNYSEDSCSLVDYANNVLQLQKITPLEYGTLNGDMLVLDVEVLLSPKADITKDLKELKLSEDYPVDPCEALLTTLPEVAIDIQSRFQKKYNSPLLSFKLIHPILLDTINYAEKPLTLGDGRKVYDTCIKIANSMGVNITEIPSCSGSKEVKTNFLENVIQSGGEGIVAYDLTKVYHPCNNRSTGMIKLKRSLSEGFALGDTIDAFVTDYTLGISGSQDEGLVTGLTFSIYVNNGGHMYESHFAKVTNFTRDAKKVFTLPDATGINPKSYIGSDGAEHWVSLNPSAYRVVGELQGQYITPIYKHLEGAYLLRWRGERSPESCVYTKEFLDANTIDTTKYKYKRPAQPFDGTDI